MKTSMINSYWWLRKAPPHTLALFRITLGIFLLAHFGRYAPHLSMLLSSDGVVLPLVSWIQTLPVVQTQILYVAGMCAIVLFTLGIFLRTAIVGILAFYLWFTLLSLHHFFNTYDNLAVLFLLILLLGGADRTLSLRMWWERGSFSVWEPISILPQRLLAMQLTGTFLGIGWVKVVSMPWSSGDILAYSLVSRWGTPLAFLAAQWNLPLSFYDTVVLGVTLLELCLPFALWMGSIRGVFLVLWSVFLLGIAGLLGIAWFLVLIPASIVFFEPEELKCIFSGIREDPSPRGVMG